MGANISFPTEIIVLHIRLLICERLAQVRPRLQIRGLVCSGFLRVWYLPLNVLGWPVSTGLPVWCAIRGPPPAPTLRALAHCGLHFPPSGIWLWALCLFICTLVCA